MDNYDSFTDEELIIRLRAGEEEIMTYLLEKYKPMVKALGRARFIMGGDEADLIQEGMIGLFKAIRSYDETKNARFSTFAYMCIERQQLSAVTKAGGKKESPLNNSSRLEDESVNGKEIGGTEDLEEKITDRIYINEIIKKASESFSTLEKEVFGYYLEGMDYREIAEKMDRPPKTVDNAIQRIKKKIRDSA